MSTSTSTLFQELTIKDLDASKYPLLRQDGDVFFDYVSYVINDSEIFFHSKDGDNFLEPPPPKKNILLKKTPVTRRSKREKKDNRNFNEEDWI